MQVFTTAQLEAAADLAGFHFVRPLHSYEEGRNGAIASPTTDAAGRPVSFGFRCTRAHEDPALEGWQADRQHEAFLLIQAVVRVARLDAIIHKPDPLSKHFHLARVGGSGRNVGRLNQRRERDLDRTIRAAVDAEACRKEVNGLAAKIRAMDPATKRQAAQDAERKATARTDARAYLERVARALPVGTTVETPCGMGAILRHNKSSVTVKYSLFREPTPYKDIILTREQLAAYRAREGA